MNDFLKPQEKKKPKALVPSEYYTLADVVGLRLFYYTSFSYVREIIKDDMAKTKILNPRVSGKGVRKRYLFKGENIIRFLKGIEAGTVDLPTKTK